MTKPTVAELKELLKEAKAEEAKRIEERALAVRPDVEAYCLKTHGLTLDQISEARSKIQPGTYRNRETGEVYTYSGRGKLKAGLKGPDGKLNPEWEEVSSAEQGNNDMLSEDTCRILARMRQDRLVKKEIQET